MEELERLRVLVEHWLEHNAEHARTYKEWADRVEAQGRKDISDVLNKLYTETERLRELFNETLRLI